jgi:xylulokinase
LQGAGTTLTSASFIGGGSRSPFWANLCATATGITMHRHEGSDVGAALGAARLARLAVTGEAVKDVCLAPPTLESCEPNRAQAPLLAHRLARYRSIYQALKASFAAA